MDRDQTPWLVVALHAPIYSSYEDHYLELDCLRQIYEPLWYDARVDLILSGHVHAVEPSNTFGLALVRVRVHICRLSTKHIYMYKPV